MLDKYVDFILKNQSADGGFPYGQSGGAVLEASAFSLMALNAYDNKIKPIELGIEYLLSLQFRTGGWLLFKNDDNSSAYATALVLLTLKNFSPDRYRNQIQKGVFYLEKNHRYARNQDMDEDVWGWNNYAYIGPEPTALVVLALKHLNVLSEYRAKQAEQFFKHHQCDSGGWTYGFPIDKNDPDSLSPAYTTLNPQLHVTALVLLAMQDKRDLYIDQAKIIEREYPKSFCPLSLSMSAITMSCYQKDNTAILYRLNKTMTEDKQVNRMVFYNALAALANLTKKGKNPLCLNR